MDLLQETGTILVVEDEWPVRQVIRIFLEANGYTVLEAGNGAAAIQMARRCEKRIHLVVADVDMPEMSGGDLAQRLVTFYPDIKLLFVSGYPRDSIIPNGGLDEATVFLQKPFTFRALGAKIRQLLGK